ncbi:MAG: hypothetical protein KGJ49_06550 [Alphaproteobacteria bacterium]|nr:hypothetical protein [Alphaproteobacteria bacterium]
MHRFRSSLLGATVLLAFSGTAAAADDWQTVQVAGDPAITIDIPAGVDQEKGVDPQKGELMAFFAENSEGDEDLACFLNRNPYSEKMDQKAWNAALASSKRSLLCETSGTDISDYELDTSHPATSNGYSAATCDGAYSDSSQKMKGVVVSNLTVAAPEAIYSLTCNASATDRDEAIAAWLAEWEDPVAHIQQSLHLPGNK